MEANERAPLLSLHDFDAIRVKAVEYGENEHERVFLAASAVMEYFEAKITSGELRVVKKAKVDASIPGFIQCSCGVDVRTDEWQKWNFCPGCGAKIVS